MTQPVCSRCQRANPVQAAYCHFDGTPLRQVAGQLPGQLPHDFVFPSGKVCRSYDELVQASQQLWSESRQLLQRGVFTQFFAACGRMDLSQAAQRAMAHADPDVGLHVFLSALPASKVEGPRIDLKPRRVILGTLHPGETRRVKLQIANLGKGLLSGTLTVAQGGDWLALPDGNNGHLEIKVADRQEIALEVRTRGLAAKQNHLGKLTVITNGGIVEVPVSVDLATMPFPRPPFQGASSPRELAERMRANPKPAVPLLESGEVARWFTANGWEYPVPVSAARGVAAVQQFFEGMGLSKPPPLQLSDSEFFFVCQPPEVVPGQVTLRTTAKKWVYAHVETDVPWLRVTTPAVSGPQQAAVGFEVDSGLLDENRVHEGNLVLHANAGQKLTVRVVVDVRRPQVPFTRRLLRPFFVGLLVLLVYRLFLAVPADVYARVLAAPAGGDLPPGSFRTWAQSPVAEPGFVKHFVLATWWLGAAGGAVLLGKRDYKLADMLCGLVAGAAAGLMGSATFACLMPALDLLPRTLWHLLGGAFGRVSLSASPWLWTPLWVLLAAACWAVLGGAAGFLLQLGGSRGLHLLAGLGRPLAWAARGVGLRAAAEFLALEA